MFKIIIDGKATNEPAGDRTPEELQHLIVQRSPGVKSVRVIEWITGGARSQEPEGDTDGDQ